MRLISQKPYYYLEGFDEVEKFEIIVEILNSFKREDENLVFGFQQKNLNKIELSIRKFIEKRTIYVNSEWVYPQSPQYKRVPQFVWFKASSHDEIQMAVKIDQLFTCVVLGDNQNIQASSYVLHVFEGLEFQVLCIEEKKEGDFISRVLPLLRKKIKIKM
jgi:hypothetical protein